MAVTRADVGGVTAAYKCRETTRARGGQIDVSAVAERSQLKTGIHRRNAQHFRIGGNNFGLG